MATDDCLKNEVKADSYSQICANIIVIGVEWPIMRLSKGLRSHDSESEEVQYLIVTQG